MSTPRALRASRIILIFPALAVTIATSAAAQPEVPQPPPRDQSATDPPARVGRLTALDGSVSFRPAADTVWGLADNNRPVTSGDRVWSDPTGRGEIQMGTATLRLWHETEVDVLRLDDNTIQLGVPQGGVVLRLSSFNSADMAEIDAPNAAVTPESTGEYRVDVSADGMTTKVTVWSGSATVTSSGSSFALAAHQVATIQGDSTSAPTYDVSDVGSSDDFDAWSSSRDDRENRALAEHRYVPNDMPGTEDLGEYGDWDNDPDYGPVWYPTQVASDWVPYHTGHWVWFGRWGWAWVDDDNWGWAPFHYGRWARVRDRWGWCPGRVIAPAVFAPALVVFIGGPTWVPAAGGGVGWFPLAPEEPYVPPYYVSQPYIRRVNITNVTNITNITNITTITNVREINYRNREVPNAVAVVPRQTFTDAGRVNEALVRVPASEIQRAPVAGTLAPVVPTTSSLIARPNNRPVVAPPPTVRERAIVAMHAPPPAAVPFATQAKVIASNSGRPLTSAQLSTLRAAPGHPATQAAVHIVPVRSAARPATSSVALKPARPGLPAAVPAVKPGQVMRPMTPPPISRPTVSAPPPTQPVSPPAVREPTPPVSPPAVREPTTAVRPTETQPPPSPPPPPPSRTPEPPPRPAVQSRPVPALRPVMPTASRSLTADYAAQRQALEAQHVQQFAKPSKTESQQTLEARQETEDRALETRYHQAAQAGQSTMPRATTPAPRPAPKPTTTTKPGERH